MQLRHLKLRGITSYTKASLIQDRLVANFLAHKASPNTVAVPRPTIITAEFNPVYTCGRREIGTVSQQQQDFLKDEGRAEFFEAMRGGQTTFHGPGQLVSYPVLDLKSHALTPRTYVCLLEKSVIRVLARYGVTAKTTDNPGVWTSDDDKICALGVHLRRNITSHGIGLNVSTDLNWFGRIVACGLEGKKTVSLRTLGVDVGVEEVGDVFVEEISKAMKDVEGVEEIGEEDLD